VATRAAAKVAVRNGHAIQNYMPSEMEAYLSSRLGYTVTMMASTWRYTTTYTISKVIGERLYARQVEISDKEIMQSRIREEFVERCLRQQAKELEAYIIVEASQGGKSERDQSNGPRHGRGEGDEG
jgi:hypothetical protein